MTPDLLHPLPIKFKKLHPNAKLPTKETGDIGWDFYCVTKSDIVMGDNRTKRYVFNTGLAAEIPDGYAILLWDRSGLSAKYGIHRLAGVIDSSYKGEIKVCLAHVASDILKIIRDGDRIVQGIVTQEIPTRVSWTEELTDSTRGESGFGSSGR
tara:strand:+ start:254 stop:712 length:459 start_codon:yes stop_codon:yes gene_type:complete